MGEIGHSWNTLVKPQVVLPILGGLALITQGVIVQALVSLYPIPLYPANGILQTLCPLTLLSFFSLNRFLLIHKTLLSIDHGLQCKISHLFSGVKL